MYNLSFSIKLIRDSVTIFEWDRLQRDLKTKKKILASFHTKNSEILGMYHLGKFLTGFAAPDINYELAKQ